MSDYRTSEDARLALKHRLYINGWNLQHDLKHAVVRPELFYVALHYADGVPVAVLVIRHKVTARRHRNVLGAAMFVRKRFRRRGIGSALISNFVDPHPTKVRSIHATRGVDGSIEFWRCNNVMPWFVKPNQPKSEWVYI